MNKSPKTKRKKRKGREHRRKPLSFCESPIEGECFESEPTVYAALHPITAAPTLDYEAVGKWVSPQFKREHILIGVKGQARAKVKDCCGESRNQKETKVRPYKLRSSTHPKATQRQSPSICRYSPISPVKKQTSCISFDMDNEANFDFRTPELGKSTNRSMRGTHHHLFSGSTPKWNQSLTILAEDTP